MFGRLAHVTVALALVLIVGACSGTAHPSTGSPPTRITVSVTQCGTGWTDIRPGQQHFLLKNTDTRSGEVLLTDAASAAVYADVEQVGPGTTAPLTIALGSGRYTFRCAMEDEATVVGPVVVVPGAVRGPTLPVNAVTQGDLIEATKSYQTYVSSRIPTLTRLTARLSAAISAGEIAAARKAWLPAHLEYERLGAAYNAFGDLDAEINGLPNGLPKGVRDGDWAGFHRLEYGLWHGESAASLKPNAAALLAAVRGLRAEFADAQIDPLEVSIRAHEIIENAVQIELTGQSDFGSRSNLATVRANLDGTRTVLRIIEPLLATRYPQLPTVTTKLTGAMVDLDALHAPTGWPSLAALPGRDRERINADLSELTELLAPIASILEPRRAS